MLVLGTLVAPGCIRRVIGLCPFFATRGKEGCPLGSGVLDFGVSPENRGNYLEYLHGIARCVEKLRVHSEI
jgi:hypothetical protein